MTKPRLTFFQHFHNGDLFVSKEYVRQVVSELRNVDVSYAHFNHEKTMRDLEIPQTATPDASLDIRLSKSKRSPWYIDYDNHLLINTWCSGFFKQNPEIAPPTAHGINHLKMRTQWDHIFRLINLKFGTTLSLKEENHYIGKINYSKFNIAPIDDYIATSHRKRILISNGEVMSNQSFKGTMQEIIEPLAMQYLNWDFFCTTRFVTSVDNIHFTDDIIPQDKSTTSELVAWSKTNCDLNEISYFSNFCDIIVGRNSGPFVYCMTDKNLLNPEKIIISFNKFEDDSLVWGIPYTAEYIWSNDYSINNITQLIEKSLENKTGIHDAT